MAPLAPAGYAYVRDWVANHSDPLQCVTDQAKIFLSQDWQKSMSFLAGLRKTRVFSKKRNPPVFFKHFLGFSEKKQVLALFLKKNTKTPF